jgi:hypothetical protein
LILLLREIRKIFKIARLSASVWKSGLKNN